MDQHQRTILVGCIVLGLVGGALIGVGPAAAEHEADDTDLDDIVIESNENGYDEANATAVERIGGALGTGYEFGTTLLAGAEGSTKAAWASISLPGSDGPTNQENAEAFQNAVAANEDTLVEGANSHTSPGTSWNTTKIVFTGHEGDDVAVYKEAELDENESKIVGVDVVDETNRSIDHIVVVEGLAAEDADEIVATASDSIRSGDRLLKEIDQAEMAGKYCSTTGILTGSGPESCDVTATYWMDESELPEYDIEED